ncbi:MAG: secondary thiamine-phosphate synthase enzyme YjbQ [SAR324 cluster bacterium]|nr:secondary thiamine-phosphate synthase enzyme YjbQ [SAR324 cluster bacterium]
MSQIQFQRELQINTRGGRLLEITSEVQCLVSESGLSEGVCHLFVRHTSASLTIQENADPTVLSDLEHFMNKLVPEFDPDYRHTIEGPDDMPAHIRSALTQVSEQIPVTGKRLMLGTWQGIFLWEHRRHGRQRKVVVNLFGNSEN